MKSCYFRLIAAEAVLLFASVTLPMETFAQGSLTPPGAPAPTMKTLAQIEPRTPISSVPFTISTPGSYYLTTNLTGVAGQNGITISTGGVTLDFCGFSLLGVPASLNGIYVAITTSNIVVRNGTISGWGSIGVDGYSFGTQNLTVENMTVSRCNFVGIYLNNQSVIRDCLVLSNQYGAGFNGSGQLIGTSSQYNTQYGFFSFGDLICDKCRSGFNNSFGFYLNRGTMNQCVAIGNSNSGVYASDSMQISGCTAMNNSFYGFNLTRGGLKQCVASGNSGTGVYFGDSGQIADSSALYNTSHGFNLTRGSVSQCVANGNTGDGVLASDVVQISGCTINNNGGYGLELQGSASVTDCSILNSSNHNVSVGEGSVVSRCIANGSKLGSGFFLGNTATIAECTANNNKIHGIDAIQRCNVVNCNAKFNVQTGIHVSYLGIVRNCLCAENGLFGIFADAGGGVTIMENTCAHNAVLGYVGTATNGAGIFVTNCPDCRIEGNMVTLNYYGIVVAANQRSTVIRNQGNNNSLNFTTLTGNTFGPVINVAGAGDISGVSGANHPWANFSF